ncbi:LPXTG cell wall anchor domain-containing protein [Enterococcus sp. LJL90]
MKRFFILCCPLLFIVMCGFLQPLAVSATTTSGSIKFTEFADIQAPQPNEPEGPQGNPTPVRQITTNQTSESGKLPKTGEQVMIRLTVFGVVILTGILLYLIVARKRDFEESFRE